MKDEADARVDSLLVARDSGFLSSPVTRMELTLEGIEGDVHAGPVRRSHGRWPWHPRKTLIANTRHVSLLAAEECAALARALGLPAIDAGLLGANIVVSGLEAFSGLPPSSRLQFPSGATLFITEENWPCGGPGEALARAHGRPELKAAFAKAAIGRRGLVALVERAGAVSVGDPMRLIRPKPHRRPAD